MAVVEIIPGLSYEGLAADVKPISGVSVGAIFAETDTQDAYTYDGHYWQKSKLSHRNYIWNPDTLNWEALTQPLIDAQNSNLNLSVDGVEGLLTENNLAQDPLSKYKISDIDPTDGNSYFGYVDKDGNWYITNITDTTARYAKGESGYAVAWNGRAGLSYDYFQNIF